MKERDCGFCDNEFDRRLAAGERTNIKFWCPVCQAEVRWDLIVSFDKAAYEKVRAAGVEEEEPFVDWLEKNGIPYQLPEGGVL